MKKIEDLTDQEILSLSQEDIEKIIRLKKAEEGIKLLPKPITPAYQSIPQPDKTVFFCNLFDDKLTFESVDELNLLISGIVGSITHSRIESGIDYTVKYQTKQLYPYSGDWDQVSSKKVYSFELYQQIKQVIFDNQKLKKEFDTEYKAYEVVFNESKWIEEEINNRVSEVIEKYNKLNSLCYKFKYDYMPLSEGSEDIAMAFMNKAYLLNDEQQKYVLANYKIV